MLNESSNQPLPSTGPTNSLQNIISEINSEDGFNYFKSYFRDFDGKFYEITLTSALNENEETTCSIGDSRQRRFPAGLGSSSDKSQHEKSAFALAYEAATRGKQNQDLVAAPDHQPCLDCQCAERYHSGEW